MTKNGKHHIPVDRVESFLEIYKCDSKWELVVLEAFHDPSEDVDLLSTTSTRTEACLITPQDWIDMDSNSV